MRVIGERARPSTASSDAGAAANRTAVAPGADFSHFIFMFPALLATFCFACSAVCGQRLSVQLGGIPANFWRLLLATGVLWLITLVFFTSSVRAETAGWYVLSGVIGFGLGDVALFLAYPHLGSRLTVLILMSFGVLFGALGDWWLLRATLRWELLGSIAVILSGLVLALHRPGDPVRWGRGLVFAMIAGWGQGFGAVLSRLAHESAARADFAVPALSQTAQRAAGGLAVAALAFAIVRQLRPDPASRPLGPLTGHPLTGHPAAGTTAAAAAAGPMTALPWTGRHRKNMPFWLVGSAFFGPIVGVSAMQWALQVLDSSALVVAITATAPLMIIPLARWLEKERLSPRALVGTGLAVIGVIMTAWFR